MPSIIITPEDFRELPASVQQVLIEKFLTPSVQGDEDLAVGPEADSAPAVDEADEMPDLSPAQARRLITGITEKTSKVLRFIANAPQGAFTIDQVRQDSGFENASELRGVWAGITRRSRNIMGDPSLMMIRWTEKPEAEDWEGQVSEMTHRSLRKAFGIA